jgi:hypothetical protein
MLVVSNPLKASKTGVFPRKKQVILNASLLRNAVLCDGHIGPNLEAVHGNHAVFDAGQ